MAKFTGLDANQAIVDYLLLDGASLPAQHRNMIRDAVVGRDPLLTVITAMETLYAARMGAQLMHDLADFVQANNFYGLVERAQAIVVVARRMLSGGTAEEEGDPESSHEFAPA